MVDLTGRQPCRKTDNNEGDRKREGEMKGGGNCRPRDPDCRTAQACSASTLGSPSPSGGGEDSV